MRTTFDYDTRRFEMGTSDSTCGTCLSVIATDFVSYDDGSIFCLSLHDICEGTW